METTANKMLVGLFTLAVLAAGFMFIYWVARSGTDPDARPITILFTDPVPGLSKGSPVTFNGVRVGEVTAIELDPANPSQTRVRLAVNPKTPVKKDTKAFLSQPSLTGLVVIDLNGGSPDGRSIWFVEDDPVLAAEPSGLADLIATARRTLGKVDGAITRVETLIDENADKVDRAVGNIEQFTEALSQNSEGISTLLASVSKAADAIARVSDPLERIIARGDTIAGAIDPEQIKTTIDALSTFSTTLSGNAENIDRLVTTLTTVSTDVSAFTGRLSEFGDRTETLLADVGGKANRLLDAMEPEKVSATIDNLSAITAAIEPERVRTAVDGIASLSQTLSDRRTDIDALVTQLSATATDISAFTKTMPDAGRKLSDILAAVEPQKVSESLDGVHQFAVALGGRSGDIDEIMNSAKAVAGRFDSISARADALLAKLDAMVGTGDGGDIIAEARATLESIRVAANSFSEQSKNIGGGVNDFTNRGLRDLQNFIRDGQRTVNRLDRVITNLERSPSQFLLGGGQRVPDYNVGTRR